MLAHSLLLPSLTERDAVGRRPGIVLPFGRPKVSKPAQTEWHAMYPCTRMHGATFEAEFYPAADDPF